MTAIAGIVGTLPCHSLGAACAQALAAQSLYGHREPSVRAENSAAFGIRLFESLPEDRFDRQPLANERLLLVADIRLDNSAEIRRALGSGQLASGAQSDADVLFAAWLQWGDQCLDRIVGDYAVAVFDRSLNRLYLARDAAGQRPLFYSRGPGGVSFASMPSGLLAGKVIQFNVRRLAQILAHTDHGEHQTAFMGISRALPGQVLEFDGIQIRSQRRWRPTITECQRPQSELIEMYRSHLDEAVACRMRRVSGPLATHLSSGYDSSAVTATAARLGSGAEDIIAYTSAPAAGSPSSALRGRPTDESKIAAETAARYGIEHVVVRSAEPLLAAIRGHARAYQEPIRNIINISWWKEIERQAAARGARTLLTAERGNMTLNAGTVVTLSEWPRRGEWRNWWRQASAIAKHWDVRWRGIMISSFQPWLPPPVIHALERLNFGAQTSWLAPFVRHRLAPRVSWKPSLLSRPQERVMLFERADPGPFRKGSLGENSIDERDPMADVRLLEFSLTLPPEQLLDRAVLRPLARKALSDRLPPAVLDMPLRAQQGGDWVSRLRQQDARDILDEISPSSTVQELLDVEMLRQIVTDWPSMNAGSMAGFAFVRDFTRALAMGVFIREVEQNPGSLGT